MCVGPPPTELRKACELRQVFDEQHLQDMGIASASDPFAVHADGLWSLFFEAVEPGSTHGRIAVASSRDLVAWDFGGIVLGEDFHLSYPCVVTDASGERFLIPESSSTGSVRLYRSEGFPYEWVLDRELLTGRVFKDSSVFRHDGRWWMFSETSSRHTNDELRLYSADDIRGPWREHPASPVVRGDASTARPAGRPVLVDGRLVRPTQDCTGAYGAAVRLVEVAILTPTSYAETSPDEPVLPLEPSAGQTFAAMHHLDAHDTADGWVTFVDGRP